MATREDARACVERELRPLIGCEIIDVWTNPDGYPVIAVKGETVGLVNLTIMSDAEGNDPGFVSVMKWGPQQ